ncbi:MAG: hypothetical protein CSB01_02970 [Bacteroidia bacterium]|nr:MAG: hypothetical protein CSB01_02970 [Bacteroidia bacterium]
MKIRHLLIASLIFLITSCAVSQGEMITRKQKRVKRMSDAKLYKKIVENYLDFNNINFKKVSITYEENGKKQEFRGSARILKDSIIWLSLSKLGIEGVRIKLTPDSVALIDRLHRKYLFTDYLYLNEKLNLELNFDIIQSFLTNQLFNYRTLFEDTAFHRNFKGKRTKTHYVFYSKRRKSRKYWKQQSNLTGNTGNTLEILLRT